MTQMNLFTKQNSFTHIESILKVTKGKSGGDK